MYTKTHVNIETTIPFTKRAKHTCAAINKKKENNENIYTTKGTGIYNLIFFLVSSNVDLQFVSAFIIYLLV